MHTKSFVFFLGLLFFGLANAQKKEEVLLTVDGTPVYISEFKKVYLKNIDLVKDDSQKNIDEYLDLFVNYKLKLKEAKALGLDQKKEYQKELSGYRKQLASGYLTDTRTSDALIKEAYDRSLERVNASHILTLVKPTASPQDTLKAYNKIIEARNKVIGGANFEEIAKSYSEDPSAVKNGGNLGWFSVFRMVYPFENKAFTTKIGEVSQPFRTRFGYHIVKVNNREKSLGEVTVAHIMVAINEKRTEDQAKTRIEEINQQLGQGVSFASLAKEYSDDPSTAIDGGKIRRFGQGVLNSETFEKTAFALQEKDELSQPIKTKYGWHIIKLIEKHPPKSFEEQKAELTSKVKRDSRSKLVTTSFMNSLKEKYGISRNEDALQYFKQIIPDTISNQEWTIEENANLNKEIFSLKDQKVTYQDFAEFLMNKRLRAGISVDGDTFVEEMFTQFESTTLLEYYDEHLEDDNADFATVFNEYKDGLLLFDLMETKIWNVAKTDSAGLRKFYDTRKEEYVQAETFKIIKASSTRKDAIEKVKKLLKQQKSLEEIKKQVNTGDAVIVLFSEEDLIKGEHKFPKGFVAEKDGITTTNEGNFITLIMVKEIVSSRVRKFKEIKGEVINDFQENMEKSWLAELRTKYPVKVDAKVLKKVKKELLK